MGTMEMYFTSVPLSKEQEILIFLTEVLGVPRFTSYETVNNMRNIRVECVELPTCTLKTVARLCQHCGCDLTIEVKTRE